MRTEIWPSSIIIRQFFKCNFHFQKKRLRNMAAGQQRKRRRGQGVLDSWPKKKSKPDRKEESDEYDKTGADGT